MVILYVQRLGAADWSDGTVERSGRDTTGMQADANSSIVLSQRASEMPDSTLEDVFPNARSPVVSWRTKEIKSRYQFIQYHR